MLSTSVVANVKVVLVGVPVTICTALKVVPPTMPLIATVSPAARRVDVVSACVTVATPVETAMFVKSKVASSGYPTRKPPTVIRSPRVAA